MKKIFVIADTHFGHKNICKFSDKHNKQLRPWNNTDEMDEEMVTRWNEIVTPNDKVYVLGDVVMNRRCLPTIGKCNGDKVLIAGNHDVFRLKEYLQYFRDRRASMCYSNIIMTHIPIHPQCLDRWIGNIHGHLHDENIMETNEYSNGTESYYKEEKDPRYLCVSAEQIDYRPILLEEAIERLRNQMGEGYENFTNV